MWAERWGLHDVFREMNPQEAGFTWFGTAPQTAHVKRRLDFFLVSESLVGNVLSVGTKAAFTSDHKPVLMTVHSGEFNERGPGYFRLNTMLLEDKGICDWVQAFWTEWEEAKDSFDSRADWLDAGLRVISSKLAVFSGIAAYLRNKEEEICRRRVEEAEERMAEHPISEAVWAEERIQRQHDWETIQVEKQRRWQQVLSEKKIIAGDRITKDTFQRLLPKRKSVQMKELMHPHLIGLPPATENASMCTYAAAYFKDILTSRSQYEDPNTDLSNHSTLWDALEVALPDLAKEELDRVVSVEELAATLGTVAKGKAPGDDGLPMEFYKLEVLLHDIRNHPLLEGLRLRSGKDCRVKALADDLLALSANTASSLEALKLCLKRYAELSEAAVNWNKSIFFLPLDFQLSVNWGMRRVQSGEAERYLGIQLALDSSTEAQSIGLQEKVKGRIRSWGSAPHLSLIGRVLAVTVAAFSVLWYVAKVRKLEKPLVQGVKGAARRFIWKPRAEEGQGYIPKVAWHTLCAPRHEGGLGLIDPEFQNLKLLANCIAKVAAAEQETDWCLLAEELLCEQWGLSRPTDVWVAITIQSFLNKRIKSKFWKDIILAWRSRKPDQVAQPSSKEEVLRQHLFENPGLRNKEGKPFSACNRPGSFGLKWIQRGISTVRDIWDELLGQWKHPASPKELLGRLPLQEERLKEIINAVPDDWVPFLGPEHVPSTGTWYRKESNGNAEFLKLEAWDSSIPGKCTMSVHEKEVSGSPELKRVGERSCYGLANLQEIKVAAVEQKEGDPPVSGRLIAGGDPLRVMCIDQTAWGWKQNSEIVWRRENQDKVARKLQTSCSEEAGQELSRKWEKTVPYLDPPSQKELQGLWTQLSKIPSQKLASLLWLQSHLAVPVARWLKMRGMPVKESCDRCNWVFETVHHLWWACPKSRRWWDWWFAHWKFWSGKDDFAGERWVLLGVMPQGISGEKGWGYAAQVCRAVMLWVIWADRNELRFKGQSLPEAQGERMFKSLLQEEIRADWRRKVRGGRSRKGMDWFQATWCQREEIIKISVDGRLEFSGWWGRVGA
ncbi:hypothetical protein CBR_g962 [Chara braunii]|uniref:Reverse transcriptase zinc-binding domain-containing protein n=1 Tax=Chara braunii TaxID=69332 RepID=A0A388KCT2_CHABU|nr:hypothetical protein CBR_g962 [Chara braunii]|eukprot:GBG67841.1 hypothetical protein CBR_g962 [Chara braunii]